MLDALRIRNLALVTDLTLELGPGYNTISGETGAGKSILIGALNLVLGERADRTLIRAEADQCTVEATFDVANLDDRTRCWIEAYCRGVGSVLERVAAELGPLPQEAVDEVRLVLVEHVLEAEAVGLRVRDAEPLGAGFVVASAPLRPAFTVPVSLATHGGAGSPGQRDCSVALPLTAVQVLLSNAWTHPPR